MNTMVSNVTLLSAIALLLISMCHATVLKDFCVADYGAPQLPGGYSCKNPANVTADDFVFSGLATAGNVSENVFNVSFKAAYSNVFPALNGLGVGLARGDLAPGGVIALHSHPGVTELVLVAKGTLTAGFIASATSGNKVFVKILKEGDVIALPPGLAHFGINTGTTDAIVYAAFSDENPGLQVFDYALFANDFASDLVASTTFLDPAEVKRLKGIFGGSG